jgi:hypothetical protein
MTDEWDKYESDLRSHREYMNRRKPKREQYGSDLEFDKALSEWEMILFCDAPNKPGYFIANND